MRRLLSIIFLFTLVASLSSCGDRRYPAKFDAAYGALVMAVSAASSQASATAIYWDADWRSRLKATDESAKESGQAREQVGRAMQQIEHPPKAYAEAYVKLKEAYGDYLDLYALAGDGVTLPKTSKQNYQAELDELKRKCHAAISQAAAFSPRSR
jgi:phage-related tail protein